MTRYDEAPEGVKQNKTHTYDTRMRVHKQMKE